jgi:hypothetical protein
MIQSAGAHGKFRLSKLPIAVHSTERHFGEAFEVRDSKSISKL